MTMRLPTLATLLLGWAVGCTQPLPIEGTPCPCPEASGFRCDSALNRCVRAAQSRTGDSPDSGAAPDAMPDPEATVCVQPGPAPVRPLEAMEYANTVMDLLGVTVDTTLLPSPVQLPGLAPDSFSPFSSQLADAYNRAADQAAAQATAQLQTLLPCPPDPPGENACARKLAERLGARAYRRPLAQAEIDELVRVFDEARRTYGPELGYRRLVQQVLASKKFYLRDEVGEGSGPRPGVVRLTPWEVATRLSYFLWATMPDETLATRAATGRLRTKADVREEAERLLDSLRAKAVIDTFHRRWLQLPILPEGDKGLPAFGALREALVTSGELTTRLALWDAPGDQAALFKGPLVGDRAMADFYGLSAPPAAGFAALSPLGDQKRFGILTLPAVLAASSADEQSNPVRRGHFVMDALLCRALPSPPASVPPTPAPKAELTTRARFEKFTSGASCMPCHGMFDPIGYALENYDGYGRWRTTDNGVPIDASWKGDLLGRPFDGPGGMAELLSTSEEVSACLASQWFRFAIGRARVETDSCTLAELEKAFMRGGRRLRPLLLAIVTSDAFLTRQAP
jgi:hypothetical protein